MALRAVQPDFADRIALAWYHAKSAFEARLPFDNDAFHVLAGAGLVILAALALRSSVSRIGPWLIVAIIELANEWSDLRTEIWPDDPGRQWVEAGKDIALTLAVPTLLLLVARIRPRLLQ